MLCLNKQKIKWEEKSADVVERFFFYIFGWLINQNNLMDRASDEMPGCQPTQSFLNDI